jgi:hypothetical protein
MKPERSMEGELCVFSGRQGTSFGTSTHRATLPRSAVCSRHPMQNGYASTTANWSGSGFSPWETTEGKLKAMENPPSRPSGGEMTVASTSVQIGI